MAASPPGRRLELLLEAQPIAVLQQHEPPLLQVRARAPRVREVEHGRAAAARDLRLLVAAAHDPGHRAGEIERARIAEVLRGAQQSQRAGGFLRRGVDHPALGKREAVGHEVRVCAARIALHAADLLARHERPGGAVRRRGPARDQRPAGAQGRAQFLLEARVLLLGLEVLPAGEPGRRVHDHRARALEFGQQRGLARCAPGSAEVGTHGGRAAARERIRAGAAEVEHQVRRAAAELARQRLGELEALAAQDQRPGLRQRQRQAAARSPRPRARHGRLGLLPLVGDPGVDALAHHGQRDGAVLEQPVVEVAPGGSAGRAAAALRRAGAGSRAGRACSPAPGPARRCSGRPRSRRCSGQSSVFSARKCSACSRDQPKACRPVSTTRRAARQAS